MKQADWTKIERKLQKETKRSLIMLLQELTNASPDAERFLHARYLKLKTTKARVAKYSQVIQSQFILSEFDHTVAWNIDKVQEIIDEYALSSQNDEEGVAELHVFSLETAVSFFSAFGDADPDIQYDLAQLAEKCHDHYYAKPTLIKRYKPRLKNIVKGGSEIKLSDMVHILNDLITPGE